MRRQSIVVVGPASITAAPTCTVWTPDVSVMVDDLVHHIPPAAIGSVRSMPSAP